MKAVVADRRVRHKLGKALMANFNWPDADEIWLGNDFVPYSFFFREYRNGNPVMCGGLILHSQENMAKAYYGKQTAADTMRNNWTETVAAWGYNSREHQGGDECECREDTAVIRAGGDVGHWRIEEQELAVPVSVAVEVSGGLVQSVCAKGGDVVADVFDLDASDYPDERKQDEAETCEEALNELINSPGWKRVW